MARRVISWTVFATVVLVAWALMAPTALGGRNDYVIVDGTSMEPTYASGDLVVTRKRGSYAVGDVVVYQAPGTVDFPVIHRIVGTDARGYVTQGDNRDQVDGWRPTEADVSGAAWFAVPRGGHVLRLLGQVPVVLALAAGWLTFVALGRQERREREGREGGPRVGGPPPAGPGPGGRTGCVPGGGPAVVPVRSSRDELSRWLLTLGLDPDGGRRVRPGPGMAVARLRARARGGGWPRPALVRPGPGSGPRSVPAGSHHRAGAVPARGRRGVLAAVIGGALLAGPVASGAGLVVSASSLEVDGGVLQTFHSEVDPCAPPPGGPDLCGEGG